MGLILGRASFLFFWRLGELSEPAAHFPHYEIFYPIFFSSLLLLVWGAVLLWQRLVTTGPASGTGVSDVGTTLALPVGLTARVVIPKNESGKEKLLLGLILFAGVMLRMYLLLGPQRMIDSDQAIFGLMARHLLYQGKFHVFFYGQPYMGSLLAVLTTPVFFFFGTSIFSLRVVSFTTSILVIYFTYVVARHIFNGTAALGASAILAISPFAIARLGVSAEGNIEMLLLGLMALDLLLLICTGSVLEGEKVKLLAGLGVVLGLAFWANLGILSVLLTTLLFLLVQERARVFKKSFVALGVSFVVGSSPLWIFNVKHGGATFRFLLQGASGSSLSQKWSDLSLHSYKFVTELLPHTFGAEHKLVVVNLLVYATYVLALIFVLFLGWARAAKKMPSLSGDKKGIRILTVVALINIVFYVGTKFGAAGAPRYILLLYIALAIFVGFLFSYLHHYSRLAAYLLLGLILVSNITGSLEIGIGAGETGKLVTFLSSHQLKYVYGGYWTSYVITFVSREQIIAAPLLDQRVIDRYPLYTEQVRSAPVRELAYLFAPGALLRKRFDEVLQKEKAHYNFNQVDGYRVYYSLSERIDPDRLR